ncbi:MAG: hypothetical protein IJV08_03330 [Bacteroidaceae bacterium]|nr:hypothetical protein [Bacteroidaceae bacterium]
MRKLFFLLFGMWFLCFATGASAADDSVIYSRGDSATTVGTGATKAETYDLAQQLNDPALVGMQVKAVRVTFPFANGLSEARVWLSRELPAIKSQRMQAPDIASKEFTPKRGYTEVVFDEPYTLTEEGLCVGYSFKLDASTSARKPVVCTRQASTGGFFLHSTQVYRTAWHDMTVELNDLAIQVVLAGNDVHQHAAGVSNIKEIEGRTGRATSTTFDIVNHGTQGVRSFDYTYEIAGQTGSKHVNLSPALPGIFGRSATVNLQLPAVAEKGSYPVVVTITKVNNEANQDLAPSGQGVAILYHTLPTHRAVLEEYTGTWCGYCPRGFVGLEEMNRLHPTDFIGISYHNRDPMEIMPSGQFPSDVSGFPAAFIDRNVSTDAFSGSAASKTFGIKTVWKNACSVTAPAEVDIQTEWTSDSILRATSLVTFPVDRDECPYEVGFILLSDGLTGTGSNWAQANYYSGETGWPTSMKQFTSGSSSIAGLTFNFVIVARSSKAGIEGSLSAPVVADVPQTFDYSFDIREAVNTAGQLVVQDKSNLSVVVLLIEKATGRIVNANKVRCGQSTIDGIGQPTQTVGIRSMRYFDLQGRPVSELRQGIFIKSETLEDGSVRTRKVKF